MRNKGVITLCECAVMLALAFALSYVRLWKMPLGGSVTLASMLPIMLIAVKHGTKVGLGTAFVYSLTQLLQGIIEGDIYWAMEPKVFIIAVLFDYIVPFTVLGLSGLFKVHGEPGVYLGMGMSVFFRFVCHYFTGVSIWRQWCPEGWIAEVYSLAYNGGYLLPDFIILLIVAVLMLRVGEIRKLLGIRQ